MAAMVVALVVPLVGSAAGDEPDPPVALLDAPNGRPVGWVRDPGLLEVLEQRPGWKRVRFEGWISDSPAASIRGEAEALPGADVILLSSDPPTRQRFQSALEQAQQEQADLHGQVNELREERNKALRIDNFSEATKRYDELDAVYEARLEDLTTLRKRLLAEMVKSLAGETLMTTFVRGDRTFELNPPGKGGYSVFIPVVEADRFPCCWEDVQVQGDDVWVEMKAKQKKKKKGKSKARKKTQD
jgi:hypothetical protein